MLIKKPHIHVPYGRFLEFAPLCRENGFDLELYVTAQDMDLLALESASGRNGSSFPLPAEKILELLDYRPALSIHAPFMDLSPGAVDEKIRAVTIERFGKTLDMACELGAKTVVFHSGYEKWKYSLRVDVWLEKSLITWEPLISRAKKEGVRIAVENIFEDNPENLAALFERFSGCENFGLCFDTGRFNLFSKLPLEDWLGPLKKHIIELHLHDNDGSTDAHRPIGDGTFPFDRLFRKLKETNEAKDGQGIVFTLEAHNKEDVFKSLKRLQEF